MFYGAKPYLFEKAKLLRKNTTEAEKRLWSKLNKKQLLGYRFKSQHPIDHYIVDFYCHQLKLVVEVDGGIHKSKDQQEYDINRSGDLEEFGLKIIRFQNEEILSSLNDVLDKLILQCKKLESKQEQKSPSGDLGVK